MSKPFQIALMFCLLLLGTSSAVLADPDPLQNLKHEHPRLFRSAAQFDSLRKVVADDPTLQVWYRRLQVDCKEMLEASPISPPLAFGGGQAQLAGRRIMTLAAMYRLDGDKYKEIRARDEMLAVARFPDWSPKSELLFGEMTFGMAVGYDWLYEYLTPAERTEIRKAIVEKGFSGGLDYYRTQTRWVKWNGNHNQIPNACMIIGALAVGDEEPDVSKKVMAGALQSLQYSMKPYAPDGGWAEGPHYWWYGGQYVFRLMAALDSATGDDLGLSKTPGLENTGAFRMHTVAPTLQNFNFADDYDGMFPFPCPEMFYLARKYNRPEYAIHERQLVGDRPGIFHLIFCDDHAPPATLPAETPRDALFRSVDVACFRSAWNDPAATYVGFKGGYDRVGHWHMDVGEFVLDSQGERFAVDLGREFYSVPDYFGKKRYDYFRANNTSHNTLTIDGKYQDRLGKSPVVAFSSTPDKAFAVVDMSAAYKLPAESLRRGMAMLNRRDVLVQDEIGSQISDPLDIVWNMYTRAQITPAGRDATLAIRGKTMHAHILSPADAQFEIGTIDVPSIQTQEPDVHSLRIHLKTPGKTASRIVVFLSPATDATPGELNPLDEWIKGAEVK